MGWRWFPLRHARPQEYTPSQGLELPRDMWRPARRAKKLRRPRPEQPLFHTARPLVTARAARFTARLHVPFAWANRQGAADVDHARATTRCGSTDGPGGPPTATAARLPNTTSRGWCTKGATRSESNCCNPRPRRRSESWQESPAPTLGDAWLMSPPTMYVRDVLVKNSRNPGHGRFSDGRSGHRGQGTAALNPRTLAHLLRVARGRRNHGGHRPQRHDARHAPRGPRSASWPASPTPCNGTPPARHATHCG